MTKTTKQLIALGCLIAGVVSIVIVGFGAHQFPIGVLILPLAWYWWRVA